MLYTIIAARFSRDLVERVQEKLNDDWKLHGSMTHILYDKEIMFYQPMTKKLKS